MARAPTMVIQEDYIDMDLTPSSPQCSLLEFEFQSTGGGASKHSREAAAAAAAAYASPADELFYRGKLLPLHLPPRLQLVQKLLQEQQIAAAAPAASASKAAEAEAGEEDEDEEAKVGGRKYFWSRRLKLMKRWASREYLKSFFFLAKPSDLGGSIANGGCGGGGEKASVLEQDELCSSHRRSFSGIIRRVRLVVATRAVAPPGTSPLCSSSSSSSSSSTPSCGNAEGFFLRARAAKPVLKRSSSAGSEEGAIQGAIAHCKRSHQQLQQGRRSASGVVFYSLANTPRISSSSSAAAANEAAQERQEMMCRG